MTDRLTANKRTLDCLCTPRTTFILTSFATPSSPSPSSLPSFPYSSPPLPFNFNSKTHQTLSSHPPFNLNLNLNLKTLQPLSSGPSFNFDSKTREPLSSHPPLDTRPTPGRGLFSISETILHPLPYFRTKQFSISSNSPSQVSIHLIFLYHHTLRSVRTTSNSASCICYASES